MARGPGDDVKGCKDGCEDALLACGRVVVNEI